MLYIVLEVYLKNLHYGTKLLIFAALYALIGYYSNLYLPMFLMLIDLIYYLYQDLPNNTPECKKPKIIKHKIKVRRNNSLNPQDYMHPLKLNKGPCEKPGPGPSGGPPYCINTNPVTDNCSDLDTITESSEESSDTIDIVTEIDRQTNNSSIEIESN